MSGLTAENRKKLDCLIAEYSLSLDKLYNEKALQKGMEETAKETLQIEPKHFRKLATAIWKDAWEATQKDIESQLDLFLLYAPSEPKPHQADRRSRVDKRPTANDYSRGVLQ